MSTEFPIRSLFLCVAAVAGSVVAENRVFDAFRASQALQCAAILDCFLAAVSALSFAPYWGLISLLFIPFGIVGRMAAKCASP